MIEAIADREFRTFRLEPGEAAGAFRALAREALHAHDGGLAEAFLTLGRRVATCQAVDSLMRSARSAPTDAPTGAVTLRFRARDIATSVLGRLADAHDTASRRVYFGLVIALGGFTELRYELEAALREHLDDPRWYVVRNAVVLLTAIGTGVPRGRWRPLAASDHRRVRLALAQEVARWTPDPAALDVLVPLVNDPDEGVRFTAAVALGTFPSGRAKAALARRAEVEHNGEVQTACLAGLRRRTSLVSE